MQLPPEDRTLSPHTGYTRAHWEAAADALLAAVEPYATEDRALYHLPGDRESWSGRLSDGLEGYARTLLLAAFRQDATALERYADGLAAGVSGVWPRIADRSQPLVEAASIAFALRITKPLLWDRLDDAVRQRTAAWLDERAHRRGLALQLGAVPGHGGRFLSSVGHDPDASRKAIDRGLERIEQWYVGEGWYTDGDGRKFDYYNGWAMHLYPVLHAWLAQDDRLLDLYGGRLSRHLDDYARLFGADGAPMHQGRSLTYRFATTVPLWLGALTGHTPLPPGETRRLASGALKYFLDRGAVDSRGLLTLGWHGPDSAVLQGYSGPASPYWASKGFLGLLLPADHEVWTAVEEPGPAERSDAVTSIAAPNWLLQSTRSDGLVRLHNHGSEDVRYDPYYTRLAYSTVTEPSESYDNSLIVGGDPNRTEIEPLGVGEGWAASRHRAAGGARVSSVVLARGAVEVRAFLVSGAEPGTPVRVTGWAARDGVRAELLPAVGLDDELSGVTGEGDTLFVALARLTADADAVPLGETVTVRAVGEGELTVVWSGGSETRVRLDGSGVEITAGG
ncbi:MULTISPECIES: DUF2264 domain-containing protein [Streptomyces]|uniref:DUF2264 domain-containing protein n=1 Tax=Streptomyces sviceus (strain ATCC 29083 / DSM 924 / JCM 4929 / NBRC 13980 / NCIMB 11184 / NRRL 5439 / UC 5370) TaxID=463191 RepID=B5HRB8_STRX2|nr:MULTISPECIES: DUF2264 domain-containing protein [Streptomyces]EDY55373.2 conserved hypothetical protein [Streptomyces sviceus ATCC 29083]MYT09254.1 DUF2264 domain-containing protein [Streptomyces sp. SID5470]